MLGLYTQTVNYLLYGEMWLGFTFWRTIEMKLTWQAIRVVLCNGIDIKGIGDMHISWDNHNTLVIGDFLKVYLEAYRHIKWFITLFHILVIDYYSFTEQKDNTLQ